MARQQNQRLTCRYKIIDQFVADGIRYMFGNPGTVEEGFLDAVTSTADFSYIEALQEGVAVGAADGYARATHKPALIQLHSGVGLANGTSLLYQAKRGHSPLIIIAGEAGLAYDALDAQNNANLVDIARPFVKYAARAVHPDSVLRLVRRAVKMSCTPPMGPVFLSLPLDVLDHVCSEKVEPSSIPTTLVLPERAAIERAAETLLVARNPMFIVGDGVAFSEAQPELQALANLVGADVWGADSSEVNMPADDPLFRGLLGHMFGSDSRKITSQADVVFVVGTYLFPEVFPALEGVFASAARVVCVDVDAYEMGKNFPFSLGLLSDPKVTLAAIHKAVRPKMSERARREATARIQFARKRARIETQSQLRQDRTARERMPMPMSRFCAEFASFVDQDTLIVDEALTNSGILCRYVPPTRPGSYFQTRGGSLGIGLPGALGVKLARPDKKVVGFAGDGGALYTIQALWTAAHHGIGAKFVICNNRKYRILELNIDRYWQERNIPPHSYPVGFGIRDPDIRFDLMAQSMGVKAVRVTSSSQVRPSIEQMIASDGPFLIDLVISD